MKNETKLTMFGPFFCQVYNIWLIKIDTTKIKKYIFKNLILFI